MSRLTLALDCGTRVALQNSLSDFVHWRSIIRHRTMNELELLQCEVPSPQLHPPTLFRGLIGGVDDVHAVPTAARAPRLQTPCAHRRCPLPTREN
jgi:hypothetical protein